MPKLEEYPILLLDDVLSELDQHRQTHLLNTIQGKVQTFVTTTSVEGIDHQTLKEASTLLCGRRNITKDTVRWNIVYSFWRGYHC